MVSVLPVARTEWVFKDSAPNQWLSTQKARVGRCGEDTDAFVPLQRQVLVAGLPAGGGGAGWDTLLALSVTKARFTGRDSMKLDNEEEVMITVFVVRSCVR